jgi:hypothetical protein
MLNVGFGSNGVVATAIGSADTRLKGIVGRGDLKEPRIDGSFLHVRCRRAHLTAYPLRTKSGHPICPHSPQRPVERRELGRGQGDGQGLLKDCGVTRVRHESARTRASVVVIIQLTRPQKQALSRGKRSHCRDIRDPGIGGIHGPD